MLVTENHGKNNVVAEDTDNSVAEDTDNYVGEEDNSVAEDTDRGMDTEKEEEEEKTVLRILKNATYARQTQGVLAKESLASRVFSFHSRVSSLDSHFLSFHSRVSYLDSQFVSFAFSFPSSAQHFLSRNPTVIFF